MLKKLLSAAALTLIVVACGEKAGQPDTDTTGSVASASQTTTDAASTTGSTGGTVSNMSEDDKTFASKAGMGGLAEVQLGNLAMKNGSNADVKTFAQRMITDHSRANQELQQLATLKGLALPTELAGEHKEAFDHLSTLNGAEFDKAYMQHMVEDHEKDVAEFEKASTSVSDPELKDWAQRTLPTLRDHLTQAKAIADKL
jgi:putative membrane protein